MDQTGLWKVTRQSMLAVCIYTFSLTVNAHLIDINGSLSTSSGIDGLSTWGAGPTTLSWDAYHPYDGCCNTIYTYTFEHPEADTFEFIIEVHPNMVDDNHGFGIYDVNSTLPNYELDYFSPDSSRPGMPETIPGIRFWGTSGNTIETISFVTDWGPMWGDFYATDANAITAAWNTGFTNPDTDPLQPTGDGLHIVVPGGGGLPIIPVPPAFWLFGSGLIGLIGAAKRKKAS